MPRKRKNIVTPRIDVETCLRCKLVEMYCICTTEELENFDEAMEKMKPSVLLAFEPGSFRVEEVDEDEDAYEYDEDE